MKKQKGEKKMGTDKKKWIIFDAMGVVFSVGDDTNDLLVPFVQNYNNEITKEQINQIYMSASLGHITSNEFWRKMEICKIGQEKEIEEKYLNSQLKIDDNFIQCVGRLKEKYHLALLSNDVSEWSDFLRKKFGLNDIFDISIISGDVKLRKPDIKIYKKLLNEIKTEAFNCVYIDDREKNLIPALLLGMKCIKFIRDDEELKTNNIKSISSFLELDKIIKKIWN